MFTGACDRDLIKEFRITVNVLNISQTPRHTHTQTTRNLLQASLNLHHSGRISFIRDHRYACVDMKTIIPIAWPSESLLTTVSTAVSEVVDSIV